MMNLEVNKEDFLEALETVVLAISPKSPLQILGGIKIKTQSGKMFLTGYNLSIGITKTIQCSSLEETEFVLSQPTNVKEVLKKTKGDIVKIEIEKNVATIKCGRGRQKIMTYEASEYPDTLMLKEDKSNFKIEISKLLNGIQKTQYAIAKTTIKPEYNGCLIDVLKNEVNVVAVDGYRLAIQNFETDMENTIEKFTIPQETIAIINKIFSKEKEEQIIDILFDGKHIFFEHNQTVVISRTIDSSRFLDYNAAIPKHPNASAKIIVDQKELSNLVSKAMVFFETSSKHPITLKVVDNNLKAYLNSTIGQFEEEIDCEVEPKITEEIKISFNPSFLNDAIKNCVGEKIKLLYFGTLQPAIIVEKNKDYFDEKSRHMILPVRTRD